MKRLFKIMTVAGLAILGLACSSDDNGITKNPEEILDVKTLKLTSNKLEVTIGDVITFSVTDGKHDIVDVVITDEDGVIITDGIWKAEKIGAFKFKATKVGYENSNEVIVEVFEKVKESSNYMIVEDVSYEIDEVWLMVETEVHEGENHPKYYYFEEKGEVVYFCKFVIDMRTSDYESENGNVIKGAVTRIFKGVIQDSNSEGLILPGAGGTEVDLDGWILAKNNTVNFDDILKFDIEMKGLNTGGQVVVFAESENGSVSYDGQFHSIRAIPQSFKRTKKGMKIKRNRTKAVEISSVQEVVGFSNYNNVYSY